MAWTASIDLESESTDVISASLWDLGSSGIAELPLADGVRIIAGFDTEDLAVAAVTALGIPAVVSAVDPAVWASSGPSKVGVGDRNLTIDASHTFGHGAHPTTQLCLQALSRLVRPNMTVLDVGTGSGVLAIAAAVLGARSATGIDIDPAAVDTASANAASNLSPTDGVTEFSSRPIGDLRSTFDLVVVNMLIAELEPIGSDVRRLAGDTSKSGGAVVVSGCLVDQAQRVMPALCSSNLPPLQVIEEAEIDGWAGLVLR